MNIEPRENGKMIDIKEEIKRYMPIGMTDVYNRAAANSLVQAVQTFSGVLKRISKEQYKYSHLLEEVLEAVEGLEQEHKSMDVLQQKYRDSEEQTMFLLNAILDLADALEDIYRYSVQFGDQALREQMSMQWTKAGNVLNRYGIIRLEGIGTLFTSSLYVAKAVVEDENIPHGQIIETIRSGYIWQDEILRKAEVVVNR
jgi:molecular chaperone GrpE (heat shock protein)